MSDMNVMNITGRLTKDAEFKTVGTNGKRLLTLDVAVNTGFGDSKQTLFMKVNMWGDRGEKIVSFLKKGTLVAVSGQLSVNTWTGKDGEQRQDLVITTYNLDFYNISQSDSSGYRPPDGGGYKPRALDAEPAF